MNELREVQPVPTQSVIASLASEPTTLPALFLRNAAEFDLPDALNYKKDGEWRHISSRTVVERSENIALGLYSFGLRKGDRAAILAANSPEWTLADAGCQFAGVVDVPIYTTLAPDSVRYIIDDSEAKIFFLQDIETFERIKTAIARSASLERFVLFNGDQVDDRFISFADLEAAGAELRASSPELSADLRNAIEPADIATLIYTSGTTGEPKGVMLTHRNLISNVVDASERYVFTGVDTSLSVLPLSHVFERTGMYVYIRYGMRVHYAESIEKVPDNLKEVRPTIFIGVPRIFEKVFERARLKAALAGRVNEMIFDWAIDVAKEYATLCEAHKPIPISLLAKHGIAFTEATEVFGDHLAKIFPDPDHSIGEQRELIVGHNRRGKLLYVSFTERLESTIRIISARAATRKERNDYEQN